MALAEEMFRIKPLFPAEGKIVDERSMMAYIALFNQYQTLSLREARADPTKCHASGNGITQAEADKMVMFVVYVKDENEGIINIEEDHIEITVTDAGSEELMVAKLDNKDGTYSAAWMPTEAGEHTVT